MRHVPAIVCLGVVASVSGGCALFPQSRESASHIQVQPSAMTTARHSSSTGGWQLGAGDNIGRAVFDHYVVIARARSNQQHHIVGAERTNSIQP